MKAGIFEDLKKIEAGLDVQSASGNMSLALAKVIALYAVSCTDESGNIRYVNQKFTEMTGFESNELLGKNFRIANPEIADDEFWMSVYDKLSQGKVWHGEVHGLKKSGEAFWADAMVVPVSLITDGEEGYLNLCTDITSIKEQHSILKNEMDKKNERIERVENMLLHSEKMASLGLIAAGIAHEINNPMSYVKSNFGHIKRYLNELSEFIKNQNNISVAAPSINGYENIEYIIRDYKSLLDETDDGIERICKIVSDLKSFSRESDGHFSETDLNNCIESALRLAGNEVKYMKKITKELSPDLKKIRASESQLTQVFLNLIVNAAQAIEKNGAIKIKTEEAGAFIVAVIEDNGCGIPIEIIDRIFEPFFTTKPVGHGTGLGLSICQDIVQRHGGRISVGRLIHGGTQFAVSLPIPANT